MTVTLRVAATIGLVCGSITAVATQLQQPPGPQSASSGGAISGVVVDAETRAPIADAVVSLGGLPAAQMRPAQVTDEKGRFVFTALDARPDGYLISVSADGYLSGRYGATPGQRMVLRDSQWVSNVRIDMFRPASISGRITDEHGDPVVGAYVRVLVQVNIAGAMHLANGPGVTTDDRGAYRLARLSPGKYFVSVPSVIASAQTAAMAPLTATATTGANAPLDPSAEIDATTRLMLGRYPMPRPTDDGRLQVYEPLFYPGVNHVGDAQTIDVTHGEDRSAADIRLRPVPAIRVTGRLQGPPEAVNGFTVRLLAPGIEHLGNGAETATALSGPDGIFVFPSVPPGRYTIDVRRASSYLASTGHLPLPEPPPPAGLRFYAPAPMISGPSSVFLRYTTTPGQTGLSYWGRATLVVDRDPVNDVTIAMQRGVTISGRAEYDPASKAPQRTPWAGVDPADGDISNGLPPGLFMITPRGDDARSFSVEGLRPGKYYLRFMGNAAIKSIVWNGRDMTYRPFETTEGRDITDVVVTFTEQRTHLNGSVRNANGQPAPGAVVIAFPVEREQWTNFGLSPPRFQSATAGTDGTFLLQTLPAGDYFVVALEAERGDGWQDPKVLELVAGSASRVTLAWGESQTVNLRVGR
jgi:hypothetical protein